MSDYKTFVASTKAFELSEGLTTYKVSTELRPAGQPLYRISARFSLDTPFGEIVSWLEAGGTVSLTQDGQKKFIVLEAQDGTERP